MHGFPVLSGCSGGARGKNDRDRIAIAIECSRLAARGKHAPNIALKDKQKAEEMWSEALEGHIADWGVKDAKAAALASEAKSYYTVIKYETKDGQAKELSRETFGQKE